MKPPKHFAGDRLPAPTAWPIELAGLSASSRRLRDRVREMARTTRPVLIVSPPGFDAGAVAGAIHALAGTGGPIAVVDCGADDPAAVESRLFGAQPARRARAEFVETISPDSAVAEANHGTLVLAAVHDLPVSAQARLARVLRDGEVRVNGSARSTRLDLRVVATSEMSLESEVRHGRFRPDLFKRFAARQLHLVPLRDRREDIAPIAVALMARAAEAGGRAPREFTRASLALLAAFGWERNITELDALVRALAAADTPAPVRVEDVLAEVDPGAVASVGAPRVSLREARRQFEREYIGAVLERSGWRMEQAARLLGIQRTNLYRKARQLGIARRARGGE